MTEEKKNKRETKKKEEWNVNLHLIARSWFFYYRCFTISHNNYLSLKQLKSICINHLYIWDLRFPICIWTKNKFLPTESLSTQFQFSLLPILIRCLFTCCNSVCFFFRKFPLTKKTQFPISNQKNLFCPDIFEYLR